MRYALILLAFQTSALASYILGPGPWTKNHMGVAAFGSDQIYIEALYTMPDGDPHVVYGFRRIVGSVWNTQIWDVGLSNSVSRVLHVAPGSGSIYTVIPTAEDSVVIGTSDPGHLWEYFPLTGATNYIKACSGRDYYNARLLSDGVIALGTYGSTAGKYGTVETYDPATQTATEFGQMDVDQNTATYIYQIGGDADYIYCRVRTLTGTEYLGVLQRSDSAKVLFWKGGFNKSVQLRTGSGNWYINQITNNGAIDVAVYWQLNGTNYPTLLGGLPSPQDGVDDHSSRNIEPDTWPASEGWEIEPTFAVVQIAGSTPQADIRWRKTGETEWNTLTETNGWLIGPYGILQVKPFGANLLWTTDSYGPIGTITPAGDLTLVAPSAGLSWFDILVKSTSDVYFAGYHAKSKRWNPTLPWTYTVSADDGDTNVNPHFINSALGKYHWFLAPANDGRIYIGSHHERGTVGGELGWFNPADYTTDSERTTFATYDIQDLKPAVGGSKMVYVSTSDGGTEGTVFVWDVATDTVSTNFTPLGTSVVLDKVVEYESGKMFGITGTRTYAFTTAGALLWTNLLPATAWTAISMADRRLTLGPDNAIWQCAGGDLYRINPADGSYTNLMDTGWDHNVTFLGVDLYLYGGGAGTNIWKVANALEYVQVSGTNSGNAYPRRRGVGRFGF